MRTYKNLAYWDGVSDDMIEGDLSTDDGIFVAGEGEKKDLYGCYAIPGLIDGHVHMCLNPGIRDPLEQVAVAKEQIKEEIRDRAFAMVKWGITTARDLGGGQWLELDIRDEIDRAETVGPRLICSGQPITSVRGHCHFWGGEASDVDTAIRVLERQVAHDVDLIKIMVTGGNITPGSRPIDSQFDDETLSKLVALSAKQNLHVAAHCHGTNGIRQAADVGVRTVEHCSWVGEEGWGRNFDESIVKKMAFNGVWVSPTINAGWRRFRNPEFVEMVRANYRKMRSAGVKLIASTDAGIPGVFHHDLPKALPEFARFCELSPLETLKAATSDCAAAIGLGAVTGRIKEGYCADFVIYEENPLKDLAVLDRPLLVVAGGREIAPD